VQAEIVRVRIRARSSFEAVGIPLHRRAPGRRGTHYVYRRSSVTMCVLHRKLAVLSNFKVSICFRFYNGSKLPRAENIRECGRTPLSPSHILFRAPRHPRRLHLSPRPFLTFCSPPCLFPFFCFIRAQYAARSHSYGQFELRFR
jgi:hypothetical protein